MIQPLPDHLRHEFAFGRVLRRRNLELLSLGRLRLSQDGTVRRYQHPNEQFWSHSDGVLSLAGRNGVTTRFDQLLSIGPFEILVGRCKVAGYDHYLYRYVPMSVKTRIQYVISSHVAYQKALDCLLPQLIASGVAAGSIWVTVAGASRREIRTSHGITFSHVPENAFEYTALIDAATRELAADYIFLLHDTCHVGPRFRELVESQPATLAIDYISIMSTGWYNIGLYSKKFLRENAEYFRSLDGITKKAAVDIELNCHETGLKRRAPLTSNFFCCQHRVTGIHHLYGDVPRKGIYLPAADLHKFCGINHSIFCP